MVGDLYINCEGGVRIVHPSAAWLKGVANVLQSLGVRASTLVSTVTIHFNRTQEEEAAAMALLDRVVAAKGGLSIVDVTS